MRNPRCLHSHACLRHKAAHAKPIREVKIVICARVDCRLGNSFVKMKGQLLAVLLVAVTARGALGIQCHVCDSGGLCTGGEMGDLQTCPTLTGFVVNQCLKFDGKLTGSVGETKVSFSGLIRACNELPEGIEEPPNQCFSNKDASDYMQHLIDEVVPDAPSTGDLGVTIEGNLCFCADDGCNGVASVKPLLWLILGVGLVQLLIK